LGLTERHLVIDVKDKVDVKILPFFKEVAAFIEDAL
jgi:hypothetical protein